jgi:hypothetical protein
VETNHAGEVFPGTREDIHKYLISKGYVFDATVGMSIEQGYFQSIDMIFI